MKKHNYIFAGMISAAVLLTVFSIIETLRFSGEDIKNAFKRIASFPISLKEINLANLSLREARYYDKLADNIVHCRLCPFECKIYPGDRGRCKVRANIRGVLRTLVYGRPIALTPDPVEKKPMFHVLPGTRAYSLATVGCNLGCIFCQNWQISQAFPEKTSDSIYAIYKGNIYPRWVLKKHFGKNISSGIISPEILVMKAKEKGCDSIAYTYTEPSIFFEYMIDTAKIAKKKGIKNLWITCGFINEKPLREFCRYLDAANVDLKAYSDKFYLKYCSANLEPVLRTLKILKEENVWFEITNLVIPGANDSPEIIEKMCVWIKSNLGSHVPVHFSRFFPRFKLKDRSPTPRKTLEMAYKIAKRTGLKYVYIGNIYIKGSENTNCPKCGNVLIRRWRPYQVNIDPLFTGKCYFCGEKIAGIWD